MRVSIPRPCLGRPAWVRGGAGALRCGATQVFADAGMTKGLAPDATEEDRLVLGRKVHRG